MRTSTGRRAAQAAAVATITLGAMGLATGGAKADAPPGGVETCPSNSVCLYFNSPGNGWGSFENWSPGQHHIDLSCCTFSHWANGSGHGVNVYGNAASIVNNTDHFVNVYLENGRYVHFEPWFAGSLNLAWNYDAALDT